MIKIYYVYRLTNILLYHTQQLYFITTTPGLHVSTPLSHHQDLQRRDPILSKSSCTLGSQELTMSRIIIEKYISIVITYICEAQRSKTLIERKKDHNALWY